MATQVQRSAKLISPAKVYYYPEAASQSFLKGEFVYLVSGKLTVVPAAVDSQVKIAGMALQDATGTTDTALAIAVAEEGVLFEMNATGAVTAITHVGGSYNLTITSNKHYIDLNAATFPRFKVKALSPRDAVGDTYGRVLVEVLGSICQLSGQTS
uniref:Uncharacterized protein n=1 Tax=viral metagenome TaxID=1070528 RepID=A0A6M3KF15_9ZZZZ